VADQQLKVVDPDPAWADRFAEQQMVVEDLLRPWLTGPVEQIGSTAVPGLRAKPVIDMLAPVGSLAEARAAVPVLADAGWLFWPEDPCGLYRLWLLRPLPEARTHHLQVVEGGHSHARALLAFRDVLRAAAGLCREYARLKAACGQPERIHQCQRSLHSAGAAAGRHRTAATGAVAGVGAAGLSAAREGAAQPWVGIAGPVGFDAADRFGRGLCHVWHRWSRPK
jgi:GrpB-like predicted nucleotidyltransferase (UPF0157 family)